MTKSCRLWSPVVYAEVEKPRSLSVELAYSLDGAPSRLEDLKVKVREYSSRRQVNILEVEFNLEILSLLENNPGNVRLFSRKESIRERVPLTDFSGPLDETRLDFIIDLHNVNWDADLKDNTIKIKILIIYYILATRQQVIEVMRDEMPVNQTGKKDDHELLYRLQAEIIKAEDDKVELKRKIHCFEKDILSLKKGIYKAENRNLFLNEEISQHQQVINNLRHTLQQKEENLNQNNDPSARHQRSSYFGFPGREDGEEGMSIGGFIKRLFQNNA